MAWKLDDDAVRRTQDAVRAIEQLKLAEQWPEPEPLIPFEFRRFELAEDLLSAGTVKAWPLYWSSDDADFVCDDSSVSVQFDVVDIGGHFRGRARDKFASPNNLGSRGVAWKPHDRLEWEIVWLQPAAAFVRGVTNGAVTGSGIVLTAGWVVASPVGGIVCDQDPAGTLDVNNPFTFDIDSGGEVVALWNNSATVWEAIQAACPA